ncbi:MAG: hypothetical protein QG611_1223 [Bacteroidota bacterium]|nr:hypothetical protein [Bacteroidota bacterium]
MKILLLTHSYPSKENTWRGIFIKEQAKVLSSQLEVIVVVFKVDYSCFAPFARYTFSKELCGNLTEYEVSVKRSLPGITQIKYLLGTYRFIRKEIMTLNKPDLIHSHFSYPGGLLGTIIRKKTNVPDILTEHTRIKNYFRSWFHKQCVIYALKNTVEIISVSNFLKNEITQVCNRHVTVIPNFADIERFESINSSPEEILNIGFLGGLSSANKGLDILLKSVTLLQGKKFTLHIGGDGTLMDRFIKISEDSGIKDNCIFYGKVIRDDIHEFFSKLDIFVLPSRYETFGIVLIEAMACGIPVIATKCGGPQEIVTSETGYLIEKDNPRELAEAIIKMSENLASFNKENIRSYARRKFHKSVFMGNILKTYNEVLKKTT